MTILNQALSSPDPSIRLRAALHAGTTPDPAHVHKLVHRLGAEPDFFVRDMLTWALTRHPKDETIPALLPMLRSAHPRARSQALHTLSKIGDGSVYPSISSSLLHDPDDEVARTAWRTAVALAPDAAVLVDELVTELGKRDVESRRSLSRTLVAVGEAARPSLEKEYRDEEARVHARATLALLDDEDLSFTDSLAQARRLHNAGQFVED